MRIAIASGKGGTGKTFVSTNLFQLTKELGFESALIDCDTEVPNDSLFFNYIQKEDSSVKRFIPSINIDKCLYCGECADMCHFNAIICISSAKYIKLIDESCHGCHACEYVCKNEAIEPSWCNIGKVTVYYENNMPILFEGKVNLKQRSPVKVIDEVLQKANGFEFDYQILDAPPGCSCPFVHTIVSADYVVLVTEPTPFGLSDLKQTIQVLKTLNIEFGVVINRSDIGSNEMKRYLSSQYITILCEIPYSMEIAEDYANGNLVIESNSKVKSIFKELFHKIQTYENSNRQR